MSLVKVNIVILGAGPTGLGAAHRLHDLGFAGRVHLIDELSQADRSLGIARDEQGFLWNPQEVTIASHYAYLDRMMNRQLSDWDAIDVHRHVWRDGHLVAAHEAAPQLPSVHETSDNLDAWLGSHFAPQGADTYLRPYYKKAWATDLAEIHGAWGLEDVTPTCGARIRPPALGLPRAATAARLPQTGDTAAFWRRIAASLPAGWLVESCRLQALDVENHRIYLKSKQRPEMFALDYDFLINSLALDTVLRHLRADDDATALRTMCVGRVVIGVGVCGSLPLALRDCHQIDFPQPDIPFFRTTLLSNISASYVPEPGTTWSALFELSVAPGQVLDLKVARDATLGCLEQKLGWCNAADIVSHFTAELSHGNLLPSKRHDGRIASALAKLEKFNILSRGALGAWHADIVGADHAFMEGVEAVERLLNNAEERIMYGSPHSISAWNERFTKARNLSAISSVRRFEMVVAHYKEDMDWLGDYCSQAIIYDKGEMPLDLVKYPRQHRLPNIGREAHTYLYHIVQNYDHLAETTLFCQGCMADSVDHWRGIDDVARQVALSSRDVVTFRHCSYFEDWEGIAHGGKWLQELKQGIMRKSDVTPRQFWMYVFGIPPPPTIVWHWGATFAIRRSAILARPRELYVKMLDMFEKLNHVNPEEGHYMERIWLSLFGAPMGAETLAEYGKFRFNSTHPVMGPPPKILE